MSEDIKANLHRYLIRGREAMLWKLDGLSDYDVRRPMVATGTNLLGLAKHLTYGEGWYFGNCFDRPFPESLPEWDITVEPDDPNGDMYARADEPREDIVARYRRACAHADETIESLPLDATGLVPWWSPPKGPPATLGRLLIHVATETHRHVGHADILRELIDESVGVMPDNSNLPDVDGDYWPEYRARLEQIARDA